MPPIFSVSARLSRLRSPPDSTLVGFCWSGPLKPNAATYARDGISTLPTIRWSRPSETTSQTVLSPSRPARFWSTYDSLTVSPTRTEPPSGFSSPTMVLNSVVLPTPFGPMMPTMPLRGSENDRLSISTRSSKPLVRSLRLDDRVAQARARRDLDLLEVELAGLLRLGGHLLVALEPGPRLGLPGLGVGAHPLQLLGEPLLQLDVLAALRRRAARPSSPGTSSSCPRSGYARPRSSSRIHSATLSRKYRSWVIAMTVPAYLARCCSSHCTLSASRWLVGSSSSSRSGCSQQQLAQRHPAALTTGELGDVGVRRRAAQRVHRQLELGVDVPRVGVVELLLELAHLLHQLVGVVGRHLLGDLVEPLQLRLGLGDRLLDVAEDGLRVVERRLLGEHADGVAGHQPGLAVARRCRCPAMILQQARLTGAVGTDHTDLGAGQEAERHVVEHDLVAVRLARLFQRRRCTGPRCGRPPSNRFGVPPAILTGRPRYAHIAPHARRHIVASMSITASLGMTRSWRSACRTHRERLDRETTCRYVAAAPRRSTRAHHGAGEAGYVFTETG